MTAIAPPSPFWSEWKDVLGQTYRPGDYVAYSYLVGKTASVQFGRVLRINRVRKNGQEITINQNYVQGTGWVTQPSCTVTVLPLTKRSGGEWSHRKYMFDYNTRTLIEQLVDDSPKTWQIAANVVKLNWIPALKEDQP